MTTAVDEAGWAHREERVNGVRLHRVEAGEGPPVLLLHGFPESWWGWCRQIQPLADAGFRVIAPDLRGYNLSEKPRGVSSYRIQALVADVEALIRHTGAERAHVAGHDWGGIIAWWLAMTAPERVERLAILNAPHPKAFRREIRTPDQMRRSWYAMAFQLPLLPEMAIRAKNFALLEAVFRAESVRPGAFTDDDIQRYKEAAARPGALTAMINYYHAAGRYPRPSTRIIEHPTLLIWGERDQALRVQLTCGLEEWVPDIRIECLPEASHWVAAEFPEKVAELLTGFLRAA
jgi:pimeloyl-ACP methyl ester carboxylesterase